MAGASSTIPQTLDRDGEDASLAYELSMRTLLETCTLPFLGERLALQISLLEGGRDISLPPSREIAATFYVNSPMKAAA